jgi:hypothetical protein
MNNTNNTAPAPATIAPQIAAALPGKWSARPISEESTWSNCYLTRADGLTLFLAGHNGGWAAKGRLLIQHSRPRNAGKWVELYGKNGAIAAPEITVADSKAPEKIAADIVARLLTESEHVEGLARGRIAAENRGEAARVDTAKAICAAIGEDVNGHEGQARASFYHRGVSLTVNTGESVRVELTATRAQALALLAFVNSPAYQSGALV